MSASAPAPEPNDAPNRLLNHFANTDASLHGLKWDDLWKDNYSPWDRGMASPGLAQLLAERKSELLPFDAASSVGSRRPRALVPGCGRGYDVLLLSAFGYNVYGLDVSETALDEARKLQKESDGRDSYATREGVEKGDVTWVLGDFFKAGFAANFEGQFDLIYDYTFLSALPPSLRPAWSKRYSDLLAPHGRLICLEWPTPKNPSLGGPPWALPSEVYVAHLSQPGQELPYDVTGHLSSAAAKVVEAGSVGAGGLRRIAHFQPRKTFKAGYNEAGEMVDWISVWARAK